MGRCIYGGIYDPGNPLSDEHGFRKDVIDAFKELNCPVVRYPGGNFCRYLPLAGRRWTQGQATSEVSLIHLFCSVQVSKSPAIVLMPPLRLLPSRYLHAALQLFACCPIWQRSVPAAADCCLVISFSPPHSHVMSTYEVGPMHSYSSCICGVELHIGTSRASALLCSCLLLRHLTLRHAAVPVWEILFALYSRHLFEHCRHLWRCSI